MFRLYRPFIVAAALCVLGGAAFMISGPGSNLKQNTLVADPLEAYAVDPEINPDVLAQARKLGKLLSREQLVNATQMKRIASQHTFDGMPMFCFSPKATADDMELLWQLVPELNPNLRYQTTSRWPGVSGANLSITWSFAPDGLAVDGGTNELFSRLDSQFAAQGGRATWISRFQSVFDRWSDLAGITYTRITFGGNDWDDGAAWGTDGNANRGEIRIAMIIMDGVNGVLAYNNFPTSEPDNGDMVLDRGENWAQGSGATNQNRFLRNVIAHEHGHGIGLLHVCPASCTKLMEPFICTAYDGLRHDDIRGAQRHYGDEHEDNNSAGTAVNIGAVSPGSPINMGALPPPLTLTSPTNSSTLSIDANTENDYYRFSVSSSVNATVSITPQGLTYDSGPQTAQCDTGTTQNSLTAANLNVQIIDTNGTTVLGTADAGASGTVETISNVLLPAAGDYYVRVYEGDVPTATQLYTLSLSVVIADNTPPTPDPMTFAVAPAGASSTSISMTATTAIDAGSPPVSYDFAFVAGGTGGDSSGPQVSTVYTDTGLQINTNYTYNVKAIDAAANDTAPSANLTAATLAEVPNAPTLANALDTNMTLVDVDGAANPNYTELAVQCVSSAPFDANWDGQFASALGSPTAGAVWQTEASWDGLTLTGMQPGTTYTFAVKARNLDLIETLPGPSAGAATDPNCTLPGDVDNSGFVDGLDIAGYVRVKLGVAIPGDVEDCADFGNGDVDLDTADFSDVLVN